MDGSRIKYDADNAIIYLPDGSRYLLDAPAGVQFIDRNGNTLTQNPTSKQWTDTLGRTIGFTLSAPTGLQIVTLPGVGASNNLSYNLVWKNLANALAPIPDTNPAQYPALRYDGNHYGQPFTPSVASPRLFDSQMPDGVWLNSDNSYPPYPFNPVVLGEIVLPNGQKYIFSYNEYGELAKVELPTGGYQRYEYNAIAGLDASLETSLYGQANRGVTKHAVWRLHDGAGADVDVYGGCARFGRLQNHGDQRQRRAVGALPARARLAWVWFGARQDRARV